MQPPPEDQLNASAENPLKPAQVIDNDDGVILDYGVQAGNPPDAPQLAPAVSRIARRAGRTPRSVTADRGYGEPATERDLQALGIRTVAIPR